MEHIDTVCAEEKKARSAFSKVVEQKPVVATDEQRARVVELLALRHKMDEDELRASVMKAEIMNIMKTADKLVDKDGTVLATWVAGDQKRSVDYAGLLKELKVAKEVVEKFTKIKTSSRKFSLEEIKQ